MAVYKRDLVDINLETGNIHRSFLKHSIGYMDQKADHFGIRAYRDGVPVDLTGVSVQGVFMPPQGSPIAITSGNIISGNVAEVVLPQACYNYDGQFTLAIKLVDATNAVTGTMRIVDGMVDNTHASGTVAPTSAVPTYQEILATYDAMIAATAAANGAIAATYSSSSTYAVGDYCIHDGGLYRCTTAITTGEAWTAGHWTAAKLGPDLSDLKSALSSDKYPFGFVNAVNGYAHETSKGITVTKKGNRIKVNGTATGNCAFCLSSGDTIPSATAAKAEWMTGLPVKTGAKYALIVTPISGSAVLIGNYAHVRLYDSSAGTTVTRSYATKSGGFIKSNTISNLFEATATNMMGIGLTFTSGDSFTDAEFVVDLIEYNNMDLFLKKTFVGDNESLTTTGKESIVGAINELVTYNASHAPTVQNPFVGFVSNYPTFSFVGENLIVSIPASTRSYWAFGYKSTANARTDITIAKNRYLVFNKTSGEFRAESASSNMSDGDIVCLIYTSGGQILGPWLVYYNIQMSRESVPLYYFDDNYLTDKVNTINSIGVSLGEQSARFIFFTDYHMEDNTCVSPVLMDYIVNNTGIKEIVFGGDAYTKDEVSKLGGYTRLCKFLEQINPCSKIATVHYISGNHEFNDPSESSAELRLSRASVYQLLNAPDHFIHCLPDTNSFYVDYPATKIRMYMVDCDYGSVITLEARKAIFDSMLDIPEGYAVMVISHTGAQYSGSAVSERVVTGLSGRFEQIMQVCAAMNDGTSVTVNLSTLGTITYDFTNKQRTFTGAIVGHVHFDGYYIYDSRFPVIVTTCDSGAYRDTQPTRIAGTITEQAFDVVQLDVAAKRIYCTRIGGGIPSGAGADRTFSFGTGAGLIT